MNPLDELEVLRARYRLPPDAELAEPFVQATDVHGASIHLVGLAVDHRGECVTGSAGSLDSFPVLRAYMELLERLCVLSVPAKPSPALGPDTAGWRAARSNGVAIGSTFDDAARRATFELVERDRVLRSWYGGAPPRPVDVDCAFASRLQSTYSFEGCLFAEAHGIRTAGVFAFPRSGAPLVYGFASRASSAAAMTAALDETIQRLGFLWGEPIPEVSPEPSPYPDFHQEHFLHPDNHDALRRWLRGEYSRGSALLVVPDPTDAPAVEELRPSWLSEELSVVRAIPRGHVPLGFGVGHPLLSTAAPRDRAVHPVA